MSIAAAALVIALQVPGILSTEAERLSVTARAEPDVATPGEPFTVIVHGLPVHGVNVYAPGNRDYRSVELALETPRGVRPAPPSYPPGQPWTFGAARELVQVYRGPFEVKQSFTVIDRSLKTVELTGVLRYQACTDKICFKAADVPVSLTVPVRRPPRRAR